MNTLKVRLHQFLEGNQSQVFANIYPLRTSEKVSPKRNEIIPAGYFAGEKDGPWTYFYLPDGRYLIEAILPSGAAIDEEVDLQGEHGERPVELHGPDSPHEWLAWQTFQDSETPAKRMRLETMITRRGAGTRQINVNLLALPSSLFHPQMKSEPPIAGWSSLRLLVHATEGAATEHLPALLDRVKELGGTFTPADSGQSDPAMTMYHFAAPGSVQWPYNTLQYGGFTYKTGNRSLILISRDNLIREVASIPIPWAQVDHSGEALVDLLIPGETSSAENMNKFLSRTSVQDRLMVSIFGYLTSGDLPRAALLAEKARDLLLEKCENPFAAVAGAYILIAGEVGGTSVMPSDQWRNWVGNLMNWFPWIPDGAIQYAYLQLQTGEYESARAAFLAAYKRGLPVYSMGVRWMLDGLTMLLDEARSEKHEDEELAAMLNTVRTVARHTNMAQPFTTVKVGVLQRR